jgi:hypothetical protein
VIGMRRTAPIATALLLLTPASFGTAPPWARAQPAPRIAPTTIYAGAPIAFEVNHGQSEPSVRFLAHMPGYTAFLTSTALVLALSGSGQTPGTSVAPAGVVRLAYDGAAPHARLVAGERLPGRVNYFLGSDPRRWHTDIPTFGRVEERNLYPGIDLTFYGRGGSLEFDWIVHPGADPSAIRLDLSGPAGAHLDGAGNLNLPVRGGHLVEQRPTVYQQIGARHVPVSGAYRLEARGAVRISLGRYDRKRPLVIDPALGYSRAIGGTHGVQGLGVGVDRAGDAYVVGATQSANFPTVHAIQQSISTDQDAFVAKFDPTGTTLLYSTYLGGSQGDDAIDVAVDRAGAAYVTGETLSTNFPTMNPLQATNRTRCSSLGKRVPCDNAFIAKLDPAGDRLIYSTYLGGDTWDEGDSIAVDTSGAAYLTGKTFSATFPTVHAFQTHNGSGACPDPSSGVVGPCADAYVAKIAPSGRSLVYSTYLGGELTDYGNSIAVNRGNAYITGFTMSNHFPLAHPLHHHPTPNGNAFVAELSADGSSLVFSTFIGGDGETALGLAAHSGTAYVTSFSSDNVSYITRFAANGSAVLYRTALSADGEVNAGSIAIDQSGNAVIVGDTTAPHLPTVHPVQPAYGGKHDVFVAALDPTGKHWIEMTYLGGSQDDFGQAVALDRQGNAYLTGITFSSNFPVTHGMGTNDGMFVARIPVTGPNARG